MLTMPGKTFDVSHIVNKKKWFRNRNGRDGAILAMKNLQRDGLGELREKGKRGSHKVKEIPSHYINCDIYLNTYSGI